MKILVEIEPKESALKRIDDWPLFVLKCLCVYLDPDEVEAISAVAVDAEAAAASVQ